jgi:hypothetical protein
MSGVGPLPEGWPTLSELESATFDYLGAFADWCEQIADLAESCFATRAENDIIGFATYTSLGPDPMGAGFGAIPFEAAPGPSWPFGLPSVAAHSSYWDEHNPALMNMGLNMGRIIAGRTDVTPSTFTP